MRNWIARLFKSGNDTTHAALPDRPPPAGVAGEPAQEAGAQLPQLLYWRWLCGLPAGDAAPAPANPAGRLVEAELARLARAPGEAADLVPRVPEVIPRLLRSLREEGVSGAELARQVTQDPMLAAEVIRDANSPFYRQAAPVRTVDAALLVLGQNGLRMLLARAAFRPIFKASSGRCARLVAPRLWLHSEHCARAASLLAPAQGADPFEAYLAGLMLDVGLTVAMRLTDQLQDAVLPADPPLVAALLAGARQLSARIALHWALPPPVGAAILRAGEPGAQPLAQVLGEADRLAEWRLLLDHGVLAPDEPPLSGLDGPGARVFERLAPQAE